MSNLQTRLAQLTAVLAFGVVAVSCNQKHSTLPPPIPVIETPAPPPVKAYYPFTDAPSWGGRLFLPDDITQPCAPPGRFRQITPRIWMWQPHFLTDGSLIDGAINEILTVTPEANPSVDPNIRGVDPTAYYPDLYPVVVVIMDPGSYSLAMDSTAQTTILATGNWWVYGTPRETWDVLYVAWRFPPGKLPLLPALNHELTHRLTRDPLANHQ